MTIEPRLLCSIVLGVMLLAGCGSPGSSLRATGVDAARLRAIRATSLNGSAGSGSVNDFAYVVSTDGNVYQLFARDSVPYEMENGLLPAGTF